MDPAGLWTAASNLRAGDTIRSAGNGPLTVVDVSPASAVAFDATPVYSLEVDDLESFAVGNLEAWGHNGKGGTPGNNQAQSKQFKGACKKIEKLINRKLAKRDKRRLHDEITGQDMGFDEIVECGCDIFGGN